MTITFQLNPENQFVKCVGEGFLLQTPTDENIARGITDINLHLVSDAINSHPEFSARWWKYADYQSKEAALADYPDLIDNT